MCGGAEAEHVCRLVSPKASDPPPDLRPSALLKAGGGCRHATRPGSNLVETQSSALNEMAATCRKAIENFRRDLVVYARRTHLLHKVDYGTGPHAAMPCHCCKRVLPIDLLEQHSDVQASDLEALRRKIAFGADALDEPLYLAALEQDPRLIQNPEVRRCVIEIQAYDHGKLHGLARDLRNQHLVCSSCLPRRSNPASMVANRASN